jgi:hypothetical protein
MSGTTNRALAKKRHPKRIIAGTFPAFPGNLYQRGDSQQMGKTTSPNVCLGKHRVTPGIDARLW